MLDDKLKKQLKSYLKMLKSNVYIGLCLNDSEKSQKLESFIKDVKGLSDKIKIEDINLPYAPAFSLRGEFDHGEIIFAGIPLGQDRKSVV